MTKVFVVRRMVRFADGNVVICDVRAFENERVADSFCTSKGRDLQRLAGAKMAVADPGRPSQGAMSGTGLDFLASIGIAEVQYGIAEAPVEGLVSLPSAPSIIVPD